MNQQTSLSKFRLKPTQTLLNNWKYWIALEIIFQLKSREIEIKDSNYIPKLTEVEIEREFKDSWSDFNNCFEKKKQSSTLSSDYESIKDYLDNKFNNIIINQINKNSDSLCERYHKAFKASLLKDFQNSSPEKVKYRVKDISKFLLSKKRFLAEERLSLENKLKSLDEAYSRLISFERNNSNWDSAWNALNFIFYYKFKLKIVIIANEIIYKLITVSQSFYNSVNKTVSLLNQVENSIKQKCSNHLISIPIFSSLNLIDVNHQQSLLEEHLEQSIVFWGNTSISWQDLEKSLINNIEPIAEDIYYQFQLSFLENSIIVENK